MFRCLLLPQDGPFCKIGMGVIYFPTMKHISLILILKTLITSLENPIIHKLRWIVSLVKKSLMSACQLLFIRPYGNYAKEVMLLYFTSCKWLQTKIVAVEYVIFTIRQKFMELLPQDGTYFCKIGKGVIYFPTKRH